MEQMVEDFIQKHYGKPSHNERIIPHYGLYYLRVPDEDAIEVTLVRKHTMKEIENWYNDQTSSPNETETR